MTHPPDRDRPHGPGETGPIEPGSAVHRLLVMVAEAIARSRSRTPPAPTDRDTSEDPNRSDDPPNAVVPVPGRSTE